MKQPLRKAAQFAHLFVLIPILVIIICPLVGMASMSSVDRFKIAITNSGIQSAIIESIIISAFVVVITLPLSLFCALSITHSNVRFKLVFSAVCTLPLFLPPISFGFALLALLGKSGFLYSFWGIRFSILGRVGIVLGHTLYTFPVSFLMFRNSFQKADMIVYENSIILGIPSYKFFCYILLPQFKKTMATVSFTIAIMSLSEYGVCLVVGGKIKTLALLIYRQISGGLDLSAGIVLEGILFIPLLLSFGADMTYQEIEKGNLQKGRTIPKNNGLDFISYIVLTIVSVSFLGIICALIVMCFSKNYPISFSFSLDHILQAVSAPYIDKYLNSVIIAFSVSSLGTILSVAAAYYACKGSSSLKKRIFYFLSVVPRTVPGLLIGIGYMVVFKGSVLYNTYSIIIAANIAHFFASPFLLSYHSLGRINPKYEDVAQLYGISRKRMFLDIYLPYLQNTILDMFFFFFSNSMITISAVVFLHNSRTMPYALLLNNFEGGLEYFGKTAAISMVILLTNLCAFLITSQLKNRYT